MIDKQMLHDFRKDFQDAIKTLEQKYGLVIELGRINFTATSFEAKFDAKEGDSKEDINEKEFKQYCKMYGLSPEDYDRRFTYKGEDYIIVGIRPSKRKYPIACTRVSDGVTYSFTVGAIKDAIK